MRRTLFFIALAVLCESPAVKAQTQSDPATQDANREVITQLKRATQELLDAIAPGDVAVWQKYLAEECLYTDEEGHVKSKADLLQELKPLPKGYIGRIKMGEPQVILQDKVIVLVHRDREELQLFGQTLTTWFHSTDTWAKQPDGQWKLVAEQVMAIPNERKPITISATKLDDYVGQYQLAPDVFYSITREGDKLYGQRNGRAKEELLPLYADVFYRKGVWRGEKVFERDAQGKVVRILDRRDNNDLVWKRVK